MKDTTMFKEYVDLIRKRVWEYSKKYGIEYSELESQGFLIYCECLEKYDVTKSGFSTYLYIQLNRLGDYAKTYNRQKGVLIQDYFAKSVEDEDLDLEQQIESRENGTTLSEFLEVAKRCLSTDAFEVMKWIVERTWEKKNKRVPTVSMAVQYFNKSREVIQKAWNECGDFYKSSDYSMYC